jgi:NAD(P)-dependent dehydrogenase (short-subunit alcohol dehydrogenase family)
MFWRRLPLLAVAAREQNNQSVAAPSFASPRVTTFQREALLRRTEMSQLSGKTALVTGASRGIGAAIAKHLARGGADVAITYSASPDKANTVVDEIKSMGRHAVAIKADAADPAAVIAAVDKTAAELGRIDILVNNAGIYTPERFENTSSADMDRIWAVNVRAPIVASQGALKHMPDGGRIINIGSCLAEHVPGPGVTLYAMSKAAIIGITKGLARDLGSRGITVNNIEPGPIDTDMNPATGESAEYQRSLLAIQRYGVPDDIAAMVAFLASDAAGFITGASYLVDGGFAA